MKGKLRFPLMDSPFLKVVCLQLWGPRDPQLRHDFYIMIRIARAHSL